MAKSNSTRRRTSKKSVAAPPVDIGNVTRVEPLETAADTGSVSMDETSRPSHEEIAEAAYHRYLSRGGTDGRDFDDWIEAERELASRRTR